ncbi:MAG: TIR domain-containing protein [Nitrospira sp.]|nr:TIR domain-containing protein [Nitrospira sp.]MDH5347351.1 TIR domain-containing protein [Nitrospira sp.]
MPTVFLSYSRADLPLIEQLEAQLTAHPEISIWRDQDKIYGGQKWPKVLGEAIADQDVFLLAWSKNSAASHFVEFEWCTAIALKKTIVPCLLDETPLPASLKTFHGYRLEDVARLITSLQAAPLADVQRREPVIRQLSEITATEETAVLAQAKMVFAQQQWTVQGNVYQAAGDIHIHNEPSTAGVPEKPKPLVERWQTLASLAVAILTAVGLTLDLPAKCSGPPPPTVPSEQPPVPFEQQLAGTVLDEATGEPLPDVVVSLPDFDMKKKTEADGSFGFRVTSQKQAQVKFTAQKNGYKTYSNYANLGNTYLRFPMEKGE